MTATNETLHDVVITADAHVGEPEDLRRRLPKKFRDQLVEFGVDEDGNLAFSLKGKRLGDGRRAPGDDQRSTGDQQRPPCPRTTSNWPSLRLSRLCLSQRQNLIHGPHAVIRHAASQKSAKTKMMLNELNHTSRSILELSLKVSGQFQENRRGV